MQLGFCISLKQLFFLTRLWFLIMKIIIWICWLPIIFRLWYIYDCLLGSWHTSVGFTFSVFSLLIFMAQWAFAFSRSEVGHWGGVGDMVGVGDKTPQRCQWRRFGVFIVCFGHVLRCLVLFPFLALGM